MDTVIFPVPKAPLGELINEEALNKDNDVFVASINLPACKLPSAIFVINSYLIVVCSMIQNPLFTDALQLPTKANSKFTNSPTGNSTSCKSIDKHYICYIMLCKLNFDTLISRDKEVICCYYCRNG